MKPQNKFSIGRHQEQAAAEQNTSKAAGSGLEFQTPEELLQHDAAQTTVPPTIARRLSQSITQPAAPRRPWWRKLMD
jgi:hypothetical protein